LAESARLGDWACPMTRNPREQARVFTGAMH
jgi:hypothetical protein